MSEPNSESIFKGFDLQQDLCSVQALFSIDSEGRWFYQGSPLPTKFARLFFSILYCENNEHFLITPVEKVKVDVEMDPIKIVDYQLLEDGKVELTLSLEVISIINSLDKLTVSDDKISCQIERNLTASFNRASYYRYINEFLS